MLASNKKQLSAFIPRLLRGSLLFAGLMIILRLRGY
ncbi:MAG: hypothetical protein ACI9A7_001002, partial [Cyclobacteriaceae bacterium]